MSAALTFQNSQSVKPNIIMLKCVPLAFMHCATATEESPRDVTAHVLGRGAERGQWPRLSFSLSPSWSPFYFDDITGASFLAKRSSTSPLSCGPPDRPAFWHTGCWLGHRSQNHCSVGLLHGRQYCLSCSQWRFMWLRIQPAAVPSCECWNSALKTAAIHFSTSSRIYHSRSLSFGSTLPGQLRKAYYVNLLYI